MRNTFKIIWFLIRVVIAIIAGFLGLLWFAMDGLTTHTTGESLNFSPEVISEMATEFNQRKNNIGYEAGNSQQQVENPNTNKISPSLKNPIPNDTIYNSSDKKDLDKVMPQKTKNYQLPIQLPNENNQQNLQTLSPVNNQNVNSNSKSNSDPFISIIK